MYIAQAGSSYPQTQVFLKEYWHLSLCIKALQVIRC